MKPSFIFSSLLFSVNVLAAPPLTTETIQFNEGSLSFEIEKTKTSLRVNDSGGPRTLMVKDCNRKSVDAFWSNLRRTVASVEMPNEKASPQNDSATIHFDQLKYTVSSDDPAISELHRVPLQSQILFIESLKLCKK
jgi:hypothetical protein